MPHLSYIGDADIGAGSNVGAGTITANYDGANKHRTTIGERRQDQRPHVVRRPGDARRRRLHRRGSVITDDVPPGALGIARERQRNVEGYAERAPRKER